MNKAKFNLSNPWMFFVLTFAVSWIFWSIAVFSSQSYASFPTLLLYTLGGFGPSIMGIILTYLTRSKDEVKDFWYRSRDFKRIPALWYLAIIILSLTPLLIAGGLSILFNGTGITLDEDFLAGFLGSLVFLIIAVLAEEFGWRGYVLEPLQNKYNAFISSIIIGIFWAIWHLPLFFISDTYQQGLGLYSIDFWMFFLMMVPHSVMYTLIYNNTDRSILSAILFHFCVNFFGQLFSFDVLVRIISNIIIIIFTILILLIYGYGTLTRKK